MNKPLTMIIKETRLKIINACNESGLSPVILDMLLQGVCSEVHFAAERQASEEEMIYEKMLKENQNEDELDGDSDE